MKYRTLFLILAWIVTIVITAVVAPFAHAWWTNTFTPKPDVYIVREQCSIVPLCGAMKPIISDDTTIAWLAFKGVVANKGASPESAYFRVEVTAPYKILPDDNPWIEKGLGNIAVDEAKMLVVIFYDPQRQELEHGEATVKLKIFGETKVWETAEFTSTW